MQPLELARSESSVESFGGYLDKLENGKVDI